MLHKVGPLGFMATTLPVRNCNRCLKEHFASKMVGTYHLESISICIVIFFKLPLIKTIVILLIKILKL